MVNFGFSAFLKLVSLNEEPQKTEIRKRLGPSTNGYDYHRSLRLHVRRYLNGQQTLADVIASAERIKKASEHLSVVTALQRLGVWHGQQRGDIVACPSVTFESPSRLFKVKFEADFGFRVVGRRTAFHLWNTMKPPLARGPTYAAMTLVAQAFLNQDDAPDDIAVLSLREPATVFRLSDVADQSRLAASLVERIEDNFRGAPPPTVPPHHRPVA